MIDVEYAAPAYPFDTGYADVAAVKANLANFDPDLPTTRPTLEQVNDWLKQATGDIDMLLAARGYTIPLVARNGYAPPANVPTINGIAATVYLKLRMVAAAYVTHFVEAARHGSEYLNADSNAKHWMEIYDDFAARLENGADNLTPFGVDGPFPPTPDEASGVSIGTLGFRSNQTPNTDPSMEGPLFTTNMEF